MVERHLRYQEIFSPLGLVSIAVQKDLYICFIDYSKAFDKVKHEKLFEMLNQLDIDGKDLRVLRNLYWDQTAAVRVDGELSEYTNIKRGGETRLCDVARPVQLVQ